MKYARVCPMCGELTEIEVTDSNAIKQIEKWERGEIYLQEIPLSADEREFLKTGYCMDCQSMLFGYDEDEETEEM